MAANTPEHLDDWEVAKNYLEDTKDMTLDDFQALREDDVLAVCTPLSLPCKGRLLKLYKANKATGEYDVGSKRMRSGDAGPPQKKKRGLELRLQELEIKTNKELKRTNLRISDIERYVGFLSMQSSRTHAERWFELGRAGLVRGPVPLAKWWGTEVEQVTEVASLPVFSGAAGCTEAHVREWADTHFGQFAPQGTEIASSFQNRVGQGCKGKQVPATLKMVGDELVTPTPLNTVAVVEHKRPLGPEEEKVSKAKLPRELVKCVVGLNQCAERIKWMLKHQPGRVFADAALLDGRAVLFVRGTLLDGRLDSFRVKFCFSEAARMDSSGTGLAMLQRFLQRPVAAHGFVGVLRIASDEQVYQARAQPLGAGRTSIVCRLDANVNVNVKDAIPVSAGDGPFVGKVYRFVDLGGARLDKDAADTESKMLELLHDVESTPQFVGRCETSSGVQVVVAKPPGHPLQTMSLDSFKTAFTVLCRAHELGIVHRDVKAANMFECESQFYLTDWGSALLLEAGAASVPNPARLGTHGHRSPYVLRTGTNRPVDDFYALVVALVLSTEDLYDEPMLNGDDSDADAAEAWFCSLSDAWQRVFEIVQAEVFDYATFIQAVEDVLRNPRSME